MVIRDEDQPELYLHKPYYDGRDVREWLQWLRLLASHPSSRRLLNLTTSKPMGAWLFKSYCENSRNGYNPSGERYLAWLSSIHYQHRASIGRVSHLDWADANLVIGHQDRQTVEGEISESLGASVDIPALIGALYLSFLALDASGFRAENVNDICSFTKLARFEGLDMEDHPKATPTPAMIQIRSVLHSANPTCCKEVGPSILNLYSSSIALLGMPDSVDPSIWRCMRCDSCPPTTEFRKPATRKLPLDTNKQQTADASVQEPVSPPLLFNHLRSHSTLDKGYCSRWFEIRN